MWFRRDLRLADNPALLAAVESARADDAGVVGLYVLDDALWSRVGSNRLAYLVDSLRALDAACGGALVVRRGDARTAVPQVAQEVGADEVHVAASHEPYGRRRDDAVEAALADAGRRLVRTGSAYAVSPGRIRTGGGTPYQVFTPFRRAWLEHGWRAPAHQPRSIPWVDLDSEPLPEAPATTARLPRAGEEAARRRWHAFVRDGLAGYGEQRDRPDLAGTSAMSVHLRWGEIHPRTMLADLAAAGSDGAPADDVATFRSELAWREFHADVLHHQPDARTRSLRDVVAEDAWAQGEAEQDRLEAWAAGRTGYPIVDAGMRQLLATGWMHNRVRMVVASFLVKDLHVRWQRGAEHFMAHLVDGDVSQNQLNWQWVAGTGYDAAPYFRVFNPVTQGKKFDPDGAYVRRWVPELRDVPAARVHEPWRLAEPPADYPAPLVDHAVERRVALDDFQRARR
ncbi:deoxyribodipyrimidine photo-lyase type I [Isoptericola sp. CG 20/1183]|uniref:Deoxyribodipyrimidine photo-lyase type I n=1 Tax=Isoptericola halotolerans TaxID=300560 RepID=A0ABX5ECI9_9MICO|nr:MULTISPECIES: deoxyribodipyrimidine photo-lyase [Isoptericola]PRZ05249.1 deoxyribodipyrimidine photo-lyase type I [Isoptericola halotolerans]PRZ05987.1 deoxyribodipyrimidine photo-lyase type I [Isoptericola sp. CG 20/1183]